MRSHSVFESSCRGGGGGNMPHLDCGMGNSFSLQSRISSNEICDAYKVGLRAKFKHWDSAIAEAMS